MQCVQNFLISSRSVVFRRFFSVVYLDTPGDLLAGLDRHSVHSRVITIRTPLFFAMKDVTPQKRSVITNQILQAHRLLAKGTYQFVRSRSIYIRPMRVSLSWLQDMVNIPISVDELADKLSVAGFEVEFC